jgi:ADP-ribosyl-[dinitrogen reductase] hydrolase
MPAGNRETFEQLVRAGKLALNRGAVFDRPPAPLPRELSMDRIEGMLLGLAIGDALGNTTESMLPAQRAAKHNEIRHYLPNQHAGWRAVGVPSDDTQLAFWTLEAILEDGGLDPARLAERFSQRTIFGIGASVRDFLREYKVGKPWFEAAARSAGNGALMRIAPVLLAHLDAPSADLWVDAALAGTVTHNAPASTGACVAFTAILWELLRMDRVPDPRWWVETYVGVARDVEGRATYTPRGGDFTEYRGPVWQFVAERLPHAYAAGLCVREACDGWWSGAYLLETVPCALYALMLHASDPQQAIIRAVNDTKDNDTIAAIVGAAVGALHGRSALPADWVQNLLGRTAADDDGRVFALLSDLAEWRQAPRVLRERLAVLEVGPGPRGPGADGLPTSGRRCGYDWLPDHGRASHSPGA